jgi:hypothetical protein
VWFCVCSSLFLFFSGQTRKYYCRLEKVSQKVCGGKLKLNRFFFGGLQVGGGDVCHYVIFWGRIRRTCFPAKNLPLLWNQKIERRRRMKRKKLLIRPLKMCLLFFKKCFTWESVNFSGSFLQFFYLKFLISTYSKDCIYVEMAQIRQNLIFNFFQISITCASTSQNI